MSVSTTNITRQRTNVRTLFTILVLATLCLSSALHAEQAQDSVSNTQLTAVATSTVSITKTRAPALPTATTIIGTLHDGIKSSETLCLKIDNTLGTLVTEQSFSLVGQHTGSIVEASVKVLPESHDCDATTLSVQIGLNDMHTAVNDSYTGELALTIVSR